MNIKEIVAILRSKTEFSRPGNFFPGMRNLAHNFVITLPTNGKEIQVIAIFILRSFFDLAHTVERMFFYKIPYKAKTPAFSRRNTGGVIRVSVHFSLLMARYTLLILFRLYWDKIGKILSVIWFD